MVQNVLDFIDEHLTALYHHPGRNCCGINAYPEQEDAAVGDRDICCADSAMYGIFGDDGGRCGNITYLFDKGKPLSVSFV